MVRAGEAMPTAAVSSGRVARWSRRLFDVLGNDLRGLHAVLRHRHVVRPGLHNYNIDSPNGRRRFHLRVSADGSAVLMVDVTDAIHLNPAGAMLVHLALDGMPIERAAASLRCRFHRVDRDESRVQAERIYALVERLMTATGPCTTCGLDQVEWSPLFSVHVSAPYKADLALSYGCNNACGHCYNLARDHRLQLAQASPPLAASQWSCVLKRLAAIGIPHVIFTGGEPTLVGELPELICKAARLGLVAGVNTNGRRLADREFAASLHAAGLDHVQITLESHRPAVHNAMTGANSFDETVCGIQNALAVGLHTITNTTLTRQNIDHAGQIVEFLHSLGLRTFAMNGMIHAGSGRGNCDALPTEALAPVLADVRNRALRHGMRFLWYTPTEYCRLSPVELELGPRRCNAGEYSICIEPNGDVLPCQSYYTPVGNILGDTWDTIWQSELFRSFRRRVTEPIEGGLPSRCESCPDLTLCGGGCRIEREGSSVQTEN